HHRRDRQHHRRRVFRPHPPQIEQRSSRSRGRGGLWLCRSADIAAAHPAGERQGVCGHLSVGRVFLCRDGDWSDVGDPDGHRTQVFRHGIGPDELGLGARGNSVACRRRFGDGCDRRSAAAVCHRDRRLDARRSERVSDASRTAIHRRHPAGGADRSGNGRSALKNRNRQRPTINHEPLTTNLRGTVAELQSLRSRQSVEYFAFYSSQLKGVVTDPALMVVPFDDHIVHRGHGIFDTAAIVAGKIYDLEAHLDRFLLSAERSKLRLPGSRAEMTDIIVQTAAAGGRRDGSIRYWLSSGPGSLELTPARGAEPGFFVMIFAGLSYPERWYTEGLRVMTTTYPIKAPLYAITKATNYLPNVLMQMEAKEKGFDNGVFIDEDGNVGESSNMN